MSYDDLYAAKADMAEIKRFLAYREEKNEFLRLMRVEEACIKLAKAMEILIARQMREKV